MAKVELGCEESQKASGKRFCGVPPSSALAPCAQRRQDGKAPGIVMLDSLRSSSTPTGWCLTTRSQKTLGCAMLDDWKSLNGL